MIPLHIVEARIVDHASDIGRLASRLIFLIEEFDRRGGASAAGFASTAQWLTWRAEMRPGTAREHVRVARALRDLPRIAAELHAGRIGFARVRAITRIASRASETDWLERARTMRADQLEELIRDIRIAALSEDPALQRRERSLTAATGPDGMLHLQARLPAIDGAIVQKALEAAAAQAGVSAETDERCEGARLPDRKRADGLVMLARTYLADGSSERRASEKHVVLVHLNTNTAEARLDLGPRLAPETFERILCDATLARVERARSTIRVGYATRTVPESLRRRLLLESRRCVYPGCGNRRFLQVHHRIPWTRGGPTHVDNLVVLCTYHHSVVHRPGFSLARDDAGRITVRTADGRTLADGELQQEGVASTGTG